MTTKRPTAKAAREENAGSVDSIFPVRCAAIEEIENLSPAGDEMPKKRTKSRQGNSSIMAEPIVSSSHLASGRSAELSEFEYGLIIANNAFNRWAVRCMSAVGMSEMTIMDVLVLHHINHRAREKKLADIAFTLNIEDTHIVNYSLKKLVALGLVKTDRRGKEVLYSTNGAGQKLCKAYFEVRERVLVSNLTGSGTEKFELSELARFLRMLSGLYDQAARAATSL